MRPRVHCCISPGQKYAFRESEDNNFGAPDWLEQSYNGLEKYEPVSRIAKPAMDMAIGINVNMKRCFS